MRTTRTKRRKEPIKEIRLRKTFVSGFDRKETLEYLQALWTDLDLRLVALSASGDIEELTGAKSESDAAKTKATIALQNVQYAVADAKATIQSKGKP